MESDQQQKRFLWGVALAWVPVVPIILSLLHSFVGINNSKATGLAVVAGGLIKEYVTIGLAAFLICEVCAMTLLFRAFSPGHPLRSAFSVMSLCVSGLTLALFGLSVWVFWLASHQRY